MSACQIDLVLNSIPSFKKRAESDATVNDAPAKAETFPPRYSEILEDLKKDPESHCSPPDCILLCRLREQILRDLGFRDIFKKVKDEENVKAISLFENVVDLNDAIEDEDKRVENLNRGIFAGNIFDLGSAQVVLAANDMPSINDVTYPELIEILAKLKDNHGKLKGVDNLILQIFSLPIPVMICRLLILQACHKSLPTWPLIYVDPVVLEGMGRREIETNLYVQFKCDSLKIVMVKHPEVALFLLEDGYTIVSSNTMKF